jgi:hypothetical protein
MARSRVRAIVTVTVSSMLLGVMAAAPAQAKGGSVGGSGNTYFLSNSFSSTADITFSYGRSDDQVYVGDWDGNGTDTLAVRRGATFYISNSYSSSKADQVITYGRSDDVVLVGDWNGDGRDTFAVRRGSQYFIKNSMSGGTADLTVVYGRSTDTALVGDWNGDGVDTFGIRRYIAPPPAGERTYRGVGDDVVDISTNGDPLILSISCATCQENFIITTNGDDYLLVNVIGSYSGRHVIDMTGRTTQLTIQADAAWQIVQDPLSIMYNDTHRSGRGDDVVYLPYGDRARFTHDGQSNFIVIAYDPGWDLLVNEIGSYAGTVPFTAPAIVQIEADGNWTVTPSY